MAGWRWARLDTGYFRNPKIRQLSPRAQLLHVSSILWCTEHTTDGQIAQRSLRDVADEAQINARWRLRTAAELEQAGLWVRNGNGWHLHDFEAMNPQAMRAVVEAERKRWRERQAARRAGMSRGDST